MGELFRLLAAFPQRAGEASVSIDLRVDGYMTAVSDMPAWALRKAVDDVLGGRVADLDQRFAPTPPQLARLVRLKLEPVSKFELHLRRLLTAKNDPPPLSEDERKRREEQVAELIGNLRPGQAA